MEDETELALLEQRLAQTNKLAARMTGILGQLDTRLVKLDKTIAPFGIQPLSKEAQNIANALSILSGKDVKTKIIKSEFAVGKQEEDIISRSVDDSNLRGYTSAIDRLVREIDRLGKNERRSTEARIKDYSRLIDVGVGKLVALMMKHVQDGSTAIVDLNKPAKDGPTTPANTLPTLGRIMPIIQYLAKLPRTSSHPAGSYIATQWNQARDTYLSLRRDFILNKCLKPAVSDLDNVMQSSSPEADGEGHREKCRTIAVIVQGLLNLMQSEQMLLDHLFPKSPAKSLTSIFRPSLNLFEDVLTSQIATVKRSLATSTFYAFGLYKTLLQHENDWQEVTAELDFEPAVPRVLAENASTLRSICLRSFPEVLVDIRASQPSAKGDTTSSTADVTYRTVQYIQTLPAFENVVTHLLGSLGDRNWLMGAIPATQKSNENDNTLQHFVTDLLSGLLEQLAFRARSMRKLVSAIFMLNNLSYIRNNLATAETAKLLGSGGEEVISRGIHNARSRYIEVWQELIALLVESTSTGAVARLTGASGDKQVVKESLAHFFARLDELEAISRQHVLSPQEPKLRDRLAQDVRNLVIPAYSSYANRHAKVADKYARSTPAEIEQRVASIVA
ncbi:exocyst complex component exo70 [Naganishia albida]|nr:exocyst complex component exo70 [Naganishia albida]